MGRIGSNPLPTTAVPTVTRLQLSDRKILILPPGRHADGNNLYLHVRGGSRAWILRFTFEEARHEMQLGNFPVLGLAEARDEAVRWLRELRAGRNPIEVRAAARRTAKALEQRESHTLEFMCRAHHERHLHVWRNPKHAAQWISSLENHVFSALGNRPIGIITPADLLDVLRPLNTEHHETAKRVRQRLEAVWEDAVLAGVAAGNLPAALIRQLRGPAKKKHFRSLDYRKLPEFVRQLRDSDAGLAVRLGFEFLILGCARTIEVRRARWSDMNRAERVWRIPGELMKSGEPHEVPLTDRMLAILDAVEPLSGGEGLVFPGYRQKALSDGAFLATLRRMKRNDETTVHGFRASFDTWASETTHLRAAIIEAALAHEEKNAVRAAYNRAEYWQQRVALAQQWTKYVTTLSEQVVPTVVETKDAISSFPVANTYAPPATGAGWQMNVSWSFSWNATVVTV